MTTAASPITAVRRSAPAFRLENLLFTTDFSEESLKALPEVSALAAHFHPRIYVAHFCVPQVNSYIPARAALEEWEREKQEAGKRMSELLARTAMKALRPEGIIVTGMAPEALVKIIQEKTIDLVVMSTHGRTGFRKFALGSFTEALARSAPCPVLTVGPHVHSSKEIRRILFPTDMSAESLAAAPYASDLAYEYGATLNALHVLPRETASNPEAPRLALQLTSEIDRHLERARTNVHGETMTASGEVVETVLKAAEEQRADLIVMGVRSAPILPAWRESVAYRVMASASVPVLTVHSSRRS